MKPSKANPQTPLFYRVENNFLKFVVDKIKGQSFVDLYETLYSSSKWCTGGLKHRLWLLQWWGWPEAVVSRT